MTSGTAAVLAVGGDGSHKTRVYLTVDVECAEERVVASRARPPLGYDLRVWGRFANQGRDLGLPLMLEELRRHGLQATFFVEPFGSSFFGQSGLAEVCQTLRAAGQDVQLHVHPVQQQVDWYTRGAERPPDQMAAYDVTVQRKLLTDGLTLLRAAGVPGTELKAFRAGHFAANNDTWQAMRQVGLTLSSNLNLCYLGRGCAIEWPSPANALFAAAEGIWELPISNFLEPGGGYRHLQVTAVSFSEMRHFLEAAHRLRIPEVTVVTHCFEFFFVDSAAEKLGHPNWINLHRWRQLCEFLGHRRGDFAVETVGTLGARLGAGGRAPVGLSAAAATLPAGKWSLRYGRLAEQALKRVSARLTRGRSASART
jgi:hypothetical protein